MTAKELKEKYLKFFESKGHKIIPSASLIPSTEVEIAGTQKVLFTTAGMHPLVPYLLGQEHTAGKRLVNVQKCFRTDDIDEIGDFWHLTFFEMLGNWSLGDYWKKEAIEWSLEFLTKEIRLEKEKIYVSVFGGDPEIPEVGSDEESVLIWKSAGIPEERIFRLGKSDNWWGPVGETGPCGPDAEMFYDTGKPKHGPDCKPGDNCGKYAEIWNDVFMEFNETADGKYEPLKQKNVDTGMGVERTAAVLQEKDNVYDTELFKPAIDLIENKSRDFNLKDARIVADHIKGAVFLAAEGVEPSNKDQGYILRRLIRRATAKARYSLEVDFPLKDIIEIYVGIYKDNYPDLLGKSEKIKDTIVKEIDQFNRTLNLGIAEFHKIAQVSNKIISGRDAFFLQATHGLTIDFLKDLAKEENLEIDEKGFDEEFKKHQEISRAGLEKKFSGGLVDQSEATTKGHTATHLLHQALRTVLGEHVHQTGSNITPERIRFDFSHGEKLTDEQIKKVGDIVNEKIKEDLPVKKEIMGLEEAKVSGAIGLFEEKYGDKVSVYSIGDFSREVCGGPHVEHTGQLGKFKIIKEEALGSGQRRIRAVLE
jgi:alanyl-tRNA synthetase